MQIKNSVSHPWMKNHGWEYENTVFHLQLIESMDVKETHEYEGPTVFSENFRV